MACFVFFFLSGCNSPTDISELPFYGNVEKNPAELEADRRLIETVTKDQTREEASKEVCRRGWEYFYSNDLKTAMKRFNQAWLLDPQNPMAIWGMGAVVGKQGQYEFSDEKLSQSIELLIQAHHFSPNNYKILTYLAYRYSIKGCVEKDKIGSDGKFYFDRANQLYEKAKQLNPEYELLYYNWGTSYYHERKYREALDMLQKAKELGFKKPIELNKFMKDIKKKID